MSAQTAVTAPLPSPGSKRDVFMSARTDQALAVIEIGITSARRCRCVCVGGLAANGSQIGRRHVTTLMRRMGIEAVYRRPNTSEPAPGHKIYPYLLRGLTIDRPNQVWATDITY